MPLPHLQITPRGRDSARDWCAGGGGRLSAMESRLAAAGRAGRGADGAAVGEAAAPAVGDSAGHDARWRERAGGRPSALAVCEQRGVVGCDQ